MERGGDVLNGAFGDYRYVQSAVKFARLNDDQGEQPGSSKPTSEFLAQQAIPQAPDKKFEREIVSILVDFGHGRKQIRLNTGTLAPALDALRTCVQDLQKSWGIDPRVDGSLTRRPFPDASAVQELMKDFPSYPLRNVPS